MLSKTANIAQIVSLAPIIAATIAIYIHHRCHHCWRLVLGKHGTVGHPTCHRHAELHTWH